MRACSLVPYEIRTLRIAARAVILFAIKRDLRQIAASLTISVVLEGVCFRRTLSWKLVSHT